MEELEKRTIRLMMEEAPELAGGRIDVILAAFLEDRSRSYIQKLIKEGSVMVDGKTVKPSFQPGPSDEIVVYLPKDKELLIEPEDIPLDVLYEDDDILVINKPKDMVVHPAPGHTGGTVVNAALWHCRGNLSGINGVLRPGIVHRIDKDTTGSLLICKNDVAHRSLAEQLASHSIDRTYHALVMGDLKDDEGIIDRPVGRHQKDRKKMAVTPGGKRAVTVYRVLERFGKITYIECRLKTGRTHQIRVHMAYLGHPVLGDEVYSKNNLPPGKQLDLAGIKMPVPEGFRGQCLHAKRLCFEHPVTGKRVETDAPLPDYFERLLKVLRDSVK